MNEMNHFCERCDEMPAEVIVIHETYAEAVCTLCKVDEAEYYSEDIVNSENDDIDF